VPYPLAVRTLSNPAGPRSAENPEHGIVGMVQDSHFGAGISTRKAPRPSLPGRERLPPALARAERLRLSIWVSFKHELQREAIYPHIAAPCRSRAREGQGNHVVSEGGNVAWRVCDSRKPNNPRTHEPKFRRRGADWSGPRHASPVVTLCPSHTGRSRAALDSKALSGRHALAISSSTSAWQG
jgi:hypothetical protein